MGRLGPYAAAFGIGCFIVGLSGGLFIGSYIHRVPSPTDPVLLEQVHSRSSQYTYINPLLYIRTSKEKSAQYEPIKRDLEKYVAEVKDSGKAQSVSVYVRDLDSGRWTGVDEDTMYTPSSLLKVALAMSAMRQIEETPEIRTKKLYYDPNDNLGTAPHVAPSKQLPEGYYRIEQLIKQMIVHSDNSASAALIKYFEAQYNDLYAAFQLPELPNNYQNFMTPRAYSSLFRALYNATYLSEDNSEKTLAQLAAANYRQGIVAGVPKGTKVAHKFGENTSVYQDDRLANIELHDCGIVYYKNPYFLCVMTEGKDFDAQEEIIKTISSVVYTHAAEL